MLLLGIWSLCDNSNTNSWIEEKLAAASHRQSTATRTYWAVMQALKQNMCACLCGCRRCQSSQDLPDELLFISDAIPTGYMGAEFCDIQPGDTVAVWGCSAVGQFAMISAYMMGAERVIDRFRNACR